MSAVDKAIHDLRDAILAEMIGLSKAHRDTLTEMADLKTTVNAVAEILHNVPRLSNVPAVYGATKQKLKKIDRDIETAWNLLDKTKAGSTA